VELLKKRREWATQSGLDPDLFEGIYKTLINWNVQKEMDLFMKKENSTI